MGPFVAVAVGGAGADGRVADIVAGEDGTVAVGAVMRGKDIHDIGDAGLFRRLAELVHEQIRKGDFRPFSGPISDRDGLPRCEKGQVLGRPEIIGMDWLLPNVEGSIPTLPELTPTARRLVELQGIRAAKPETEE